MLRLLLGSHFIRSEDGGNAAEFAMVVLPMSILMLVVLQVGSLMYVYNDMHNAAREAVRRFAVQDDITYGNAPPYDCSNTQVAGSVEEVACARLMGWTVDFRVTAENLGLAGGAVNCEELRVTVETTMGSAALFDTFGILGSRPLRASAYMVSEYIPSTGDQACG